MSAWTRLRHWRDALLRVWSGSRERSDARVRAYLDGDRHLAGEAPERWATLLLGCARLAVRRSAAEGRAPLDRFADLVADLALETVDRGPCSQARVTGLIRALLHVDRRMAGRDLLNVRRGGGSAGPWDAVAQRIHAVLEGLRDVEPLGDQAELYRDAAREALWASGPLLEAISANPSIGVGFALLDDDELERAAVGNSELALMIECQPGGGGARGQLLLRLVAMEAGGPTPRRDVLDALDRALTLTRRLDALRVADGDPESWLKYDTHQLEAARCVAAAAPDRASSVAAAAQLLMHGGSLAGTRDGEIESTAVALALLVLVAPSIATRQDFRVQLDRAIADLLAADELSSARISALAAACSLYQDVVTLLPTAPSHARPEGFDIPHPGLTVGQIRNRSATPSRPDDETPISLQLMALEWLSQNGDWSAERRAFAAPFMEDPPSIVGAPVSAWPAIALGAISISLQELSRAGDDRRSAEAAGMRSSRFLGELGRTIGMLDLPSTAQVQAYHLAHGGVLHMRHLLSGRARDAVPDISAWGPAPQAAETLGLLGDRCAQVRQAAVPFLPGGRHVHEAHPREWEDLILGAAVTPGWTARMDVPERTVTPEEAGDLLHRLMDAAWEHGTPAPRWVGRFGAAIRVFRGMAGLAPPDYCERIRLAGKGLQQHLDHLCGQADDHGSGDHGSGPLSSDDDGGGGGGRGDGGDGGGHGGGDDPNPGEAPPSSGPIYGDRDSSQYELAVTATRQYELAVTATRLLRGDPSPPPGGDRPSKTAAGGVQGARHLQPPPVAARRSAGAGPPLP